MVITSDWRLLLGSSHFGNRSAPSINSKKGTKIVIQNTLRQELCEFT